MKSEEKIEEPKLRLHAFKHKFGTESYVISCSARSQRSLEAQLRAGIRPLATDVGRFRNIQEET